MSSITFDTLDATRRLRDAGFDEKQAEAVVRVLSDSQERLVTREHFDFKMETLGKDIQTLERRLTIKLGAFIAAATGVIIAVLRLSN